MTDLELLFEAAGRGDIATLNRLLDTGLDPDVVYTETGATPLYNACPDQVESARVLLARGADPNKRITYRSWVNDRVEKDVVVLMFATSAPLAAVLLDAGADPRARDGEGRTVLMRIAGAAPSEVFQMLIRAGADVTARANDGRTAADYVRQKIDWWRQFAPTRNPEHQEDLQRVLALLQD